MRIAVFVGAVLVASGLVASPVWAEDAVAIVAGVYGERVVERAVGPAELLAQGGAVEFPLATLEEHGVLTERFRKLRRALDGSGEDGSSWTESTVRGRLVEWGHAAATLAAAEALGESRTEIERHRKAVANAKSFTDEARALLSWLESRAYLSWERIGEARGLAGGDLVRVGTGTEACLVFQASRLHFRLAGGAVFAMDAPAPGHGPRPRPSPTLLAGRTDAYRGDLAGRPKAWILAVRTPLLDVSFSDLTHAVVTHADGVSTIEVKKMGTARVLDRPTSASRGVDATSDVRTFDARGPVARQVAGAPTGWRRHALGPLSMLVPAGYSPAPEGRGSVRAWNKTDDSPGQRASISLFTADFESFFEAADEVRRKSTTVEGEPVTSMSGTFGAASEKVRFRVVHFEPFEDGERRTVEGAMVMAPPDLWEKDRAVLDQALASLRREDIRTGPNEWYCPMHLHIVRAAPGTCPICGMVLSARVGGGVRLRRVGSATFEVPSSWSETAPSTEEPEGGWAARPDAGDPAPTEIRVLRDTADALKTRLATIAGRTSKPTTLGGLPATAHEGTTSEGSVQTLLLATDAPVEGDALVVVVLRSASPRWTTDAPILRHVLASVQIRR